MFQAEVLVVLTRASDFVEESSHRADFYFLKIMQMPVPALKEQIASVTGVLSEQQRLICRGKVLKDDQLLSAYRILIFIRFYSFKSRNDLSIFGVLLVESCGFLILYSCFLLFLHVLVFRHFWQKFLKVNILLFFNAHVSCVPS